MEQIVRHFIGDVPNDINELRRVSETLDREHTRLPGSIGNEGAYDSDDLAIADESFTMEEISGNAAREFCSRVRARLQSTP
jgi:hypothetical protein